MDHRLCMYNMHYETGVGLKHEFIDGIRNFIEHTMTLDIFNNNGLVRVKVHLYRNGFKPTYFVWIYHRESDGLDGMFYNSMPMDVYNMVAPHGQIRVEHVRVEHDRVEHDRVHEMINDAFGVQGWMEPKQYFDETLNEEERRCYDHLEESSHPLWERSPHDRILDSRRNRINHNDEGDIDPLFLSISIFNQNGRGSKKHGKQGFTIWKCNLL
ncbi:hypothetical protein H5410_002789 [Solanum commersonii]|uniref:Uncharacterized protein n=1 Tax=Solanum commersonii TaxID=4109 RepID=A0A9J6B361_SOLCO|nr:hypothetical protein H5410_002789 [Solanum commersonii]